jgi:hypothetical protein
MKTFEELKPDACRWPMAEFDRGEFLFCGEPVARDECRYCADHAALAYKRRRPARLQSLEAPAQRELIAIAAAVR